MPEQRVCIFREMRLQARQADMAAKTVHALRSPAKKA